MRALTWNEATYVSGGFVPPRIDEIETQQLERVEIVGAPGGYVEMNDIASEMAVTSGLAAGVGWAIARQMGAEATAALGFAGITAIGAAALAGAFAVGWNIGTWINNWISQP